MALTSETQREWLNLTSEEVVDPQREIIDPHHHLWRRSSLPTYVLDDLWGDAVNTAARMESHGIPNRIHLSSDTAALIGGRYAVESRGVIEIKGKGQMETFLLSA